MPTPNAHHEQNLTPGVAKDIAQARIRSKAAGEEESEKNQTQIESA